jgi:hypothetical protein
MSRQVINWMFSVALALVATVAAAGEAWSFWPQQIEAGEWIVTVYQPQTDSFEQDRLESRAAVSVKRADGSGEPVFGAVWLSSRVEVDRDARLMSVRSLEVPQVRFADSEREDRDALAKLLETEIPKWNLTFDLDRFIVEFGDSTGSTTTPGLKNDPPEFVYAHEPSVLLLFDGEPRTEPLDGADGLESVVNTPLPVVRETGGSSFYLFGGEDYWYAAPDPEGPWQPTDRVPAKVRKLMESVEAPEDFEVDAERVAPPKIVVATDRADRHGG